MSKMHCIIMLCLGLLNSLCAVEGGSTRYTLGYNAVTGGYLPTPGTLEVRNDIYHRASHIKGSINVKTTLDIVQMKYVTNLKLFGGDYGYSIIIPAGRINVHKTQITNLQKTKLHQVAHGVGDLVVFPIRLGWHWENIDAQFAQSVYLPTATYSKDKIANMGRHYYATDSSAGITWNIPQIGVEFCGYTGVIINFMNHKTHYRSGSGWHNEFLVSKTIVSNLKLGITGYSFNQISRDSGSGATLGGYRGRLFAVGPSLSYGFKCWDVPFNANVRYYHDTSAKHHQRGDSFFLTLTARF